MAIQFACPGCTQPIEVDDEIAGKSAACPYCQRVVTVPIASTYTPQPISARPASSTAETDVLGAPAAPNRPLPPAPTTPYSSPEPPAAPYSPGGLHVGPHPDARIRAARRLGSIGLVCAVLSAALFVGALMQTNTLIQKLGLTTDGTSLPTSQQWNEMASSPEAQQMGMMFCAMAPLCVAGLVLAILSLRRTAAGNWPGWAALLISGGVIGSIVIGLFLQRMMGLG